MTPVSASKNRPDHPQVHPTRSAFRACKTILAILMLVGLVGCGYDLYEERLGHTKLYFAYLEKVENFLAPKFADAGVEIRPPRQFETIPRPTPPKKETKPGEKPSASSSELPLVDLRQPDYINITFPGLLAAWKAPLTVPVKDKSETRMAYLYLLSNYWDFAKAETAKDAPNFSQKVMNLVWNELDIPERDRKADPSSYPKTRSFVPRKEYSEALVRPQKLIDGVKYQFDAYLHQQGDVQAVIVLVVPAGADGIEQLNTGVSLMLENLIVREEKPRMGSSAGSGPPPGPSVSF